MYVRAPHKCTCVLRCSSRCMSRRMNAHTCVCTRLLFLWSCLCSWIILKKLARAHVRENDDTKCMQAKNTRAYAHGYYRRTHACVCLCVCVFYIIIVYIHTCIHIFISFAQRASTFKSRTLNVQKLSRKGMYLQAVIPFGLETAWWDTYMHQCIHGRRRTCDPCMSKHICIHIIKQKHVYKHTFLISFATTAAWSVCGSSSSWVPRARQP